MRKKSFKTIVNEVKKKPVSYQFFSIFIVPQFLMYLKDSKIRFNGRRKEESFHEKNRPCVIMSKTDMHAMFIPGSTKGGSRRNDPYTLFIKRGDIPGLIKDGVLLARYYQNEPANFFEEANINSIGKKVPDEIFEKLQQKLNHFIESQGK